MLTACLDWDDSQTALAHLGGAPPGGAKSQGDKLWEDNWDDDDIEDDFNVQLRYAFAYRLSFYLTLKYARSLGRRAAQKRTGKEEGQRRRPRADAALKSWNGCMRMKF